MIRRIDIPTALDDALKEWGADAAQRADAVAILGPQCTMHGELVIFGPTKTAIDQPAVREWLEANKPTCCRANSTKAWPIELSSAKATARRLPSFTSK